MTRGLILIQAMKTTNSSDTRKPRRLYPLKTRKLFSENKKPQKKDIKRMCCTPKNVKSFFLKTRTLQKGTAARGLCPFLHHGLFYVFFILIYLRPYMVSQMFAQKSSANYLVPRVFAQKGFAISIFGHFFCPFSENFIESCRVKIKNNKIILHVLL